MINVENLSIYISSEPLLKNIQFEIKKGHVYHFSGPNGCGKSTLFDVLLGLNSNCKGSIQKDVLSDGYAYLPQVAHKFPKIYLQMRDICDQDYGFYPKSLFDKGWHEASGGERKKALIAKSFSEAENLLLLDEPFNHLDVESQKLICDEMTRFTTNGGTILYIGHGDHNLDEIEIKVDQWKC